MSSCQPLLDSFECRSCDVDVSSLGILARTLRLMNPLDNCFTCSERTTFSSLPVVEVQKLNGRTLDRNNSLIDVVPEHLGLEYHVLDAAFRTASSDCRTPTRPNLPSLYLYLYCPSLRLAYASSLHPRAQVSADCTLGLVYSYV